MRKSFTLICSTVFVAVCFSSRAQGDMVNYTLDANEPITGCKVVAIKGEHDVGNVKSIAGSNLNLRIHKDNVYKVTINEEQVYFLEYEGEDGFAQVEGVSITTSNLSQSLAISSGEAAESDPGIKYRVQIGAFKRDVSSQSFKSLGDIYTEEIDGGFTRYMIGSFTSPEKAAEAQMTIRNMGYESAFAVVCYNGKRISFFEAQRLVAGN